MDIAAFLNALGATILWSVVATVIASVLFEVLERLYNLRREIFEDNNTAAGILAGAFVLGIFYTVTQIVIH